METTTKVYGAGTMIKVAQRMVRSNNSLHAALGAVILHGEYRDMRKVFVNWERVTDQYM
jgi:hypothetical protein